MNFTLKHDAIELTEAEAQALVWLGTADKWTGDIKVTRGSEREFDLNIRGQHTGYGTPIRFGAWFVLGCLHQWWGDKKWGRYVEDHGSGDWSFVRDACKSAHWSMFTNILQLARKA